MEPSVQLLGLDHVDKCVLIDPTDHRYELTLRFRVDDGVDEGFLLLLVTSATHEQSSVRVRQVDDGVVDLILFVGVDDHRFFLISLIQKLDHLRAAELVDDGVQSL